LSAVKEVRILNFDIVGQKAYIKDGPHRNRIGTVKKNEKQLESHFAIVIGEQSIAVELKDIVLVGVDVGQFHKWCEQNGYL
jgi:ribosomal protein S4E